MVCRLLSLLFLFEIFVSILYVEASQSVIRNKNGEKSAVFLSPMFVLGPGSVDNKFYYNIDFPKGHIALKEFNAEIVDEAGKSVPLHETYIHHWLIVRYHAPKNNGHKESNRSKNIIVRNSGICDNLGQYFGLGSETRRTATRVPDPYGIEIGDPTSIPDGYEERWLLNIHAIDTRHVEDRLGCTECKCDLYNVTKGRSGQPLPLGYTGGLRCCHDEAQCRLRAGHGSIKRNLYVKYTARWVDWKHTIVPVKIYILDVTFTREIRNDFTDSCKVEYDIEVCSKTAIASNMCIDNKKTSMVMPKGGYVIYGVAHQHTGGIGTALYGEDGRVICSSIPAYGEGSEAGNEAGYIVGMSTCYPQPGSIKISDGETVVLESNYSSTQKHTGVMGLFYLLVAEQLPEPVHMEKHMNRNFKLSNYTWPLVFVGVAIAIFVGVGYKRRGEGQGGYESLGI